MTNCNISHSSDKSHVHLSNHTSCCTWQTVTFHIAVTSHICTSLITHLAAHDCDTGTERFRTRDTWHCNHEFVVVTTTAAGFVSRSEAEDSDPGKIDPVAPVSYPGSIAAQFSWLPSVQQMCLTLFYSVNKGHRFVNFRRAKLIRVRRQTLVLLFKKSST
jgi:hypothetical protein